MPALANHVNDELMANADEIGRAWQRLADTIAADRAVNVTYRSESVRTDAYRVAELAARLAGGDANPDYNGYPNRETWATHLHLTNTESLYDYARAIAARPGIAGDDGLRDLCDDIKAAALDPLEPSLPVLSRADCRSMVADVGSLYRVDWRRITDALREV